MIQICSLLSSDNNFHYPSHYCLLFAAAAAKSLQPCPTLCDPIDGSPPGSPIPGILQAGTLGWAAIYFSCLLFRLLQLISISTLTFSSLLLYFTQQYYICPFVSISSSIHPPIHPSTHPFISIWYIELSSLPFLPENLATLKIQFLLVIWNSLAFFLPSGFTHSVTSASEVYYSIHFYISWEGTHIEKTFFSFQTHIVHCM